MSSPTPATGMFEPFEDLTELTLPDPDALYDTLMEPICPELTTKGMAALAEDSVPLTSEEQETRTKRYEEAFDAYDQAFKTTMDTVQVRAQSYRHDALTFSEGVSREDDQGAMGALDSQIAAL